MDFQQGTYCKVWGGEGGINMIIFKELVDRVYHFKFRECKGCVIFVDVTRIYNIKMRIIFF